MISSIITILRISWRDLWRNRKRSVLVGLSMAFSTFIMVFAVGMNSGLVDDMAATVTGSFLGHAQIQNPNYIDQPSLESALLADQLEAMTPLLESDSRVLDFSPRLTTGGLLSKKVPDPPDDHDMGSYRQMTSKGAMIVGVDAVGERHVGNLAKSIAPDAPRIRCLRGCAAGLAEIGIAPDDRCLRMCPETMDGFAGDACQRKCTDVCAGRCGDDDPLCDDTDCQERCSDYCEPARFLAATDPFAGQPYRGEVVLGRELARVLRVDVGDRVAATSGTVDGRVHGAIWRVCGLLETSQVALNRTVALTHRAALAEGVGVPGGATTVVLKFADFEGASDVAAGIEGALASDTSLATVRVRSWGELAPDVETFIRLKFGGTFVMMLVFTLIVAVIVANVVTMAVLERTREYGVRLALGESPGRIIATVLFEAIFSALLFGGLGTILGVALVSHLSTTGMDMGMGKMETAGVMLTGILYPRVTATGILFAMGSVLTFSVAGSLYPALRIRQVKVTDALHFS